MSTIDERIVQMKIDNKQFLPGVKASKSALSDLNKSVDNAGKNRGLNKMGDNINGVKVKLGALNTAAMTAVATITNKLVTAGITMVKSLTLDPIMAGFREYETNLNSIQTIMANTGAKVDTVNKYLTELNEYSDQTIYNFSQMASAIGKFTAAGVKLAPATAAIKGMANVAALSGANVDQLNSAMYQMSQALSSGVIKLMDWNSLQQASMGGTNIQKALKATATTLGDHGKAMEAAIIKHGSFRDSLREGWLTADVFTKTMRVFSGTTDKLTGKTIAYTKAQLVSMGYTKKQATELNRLSSASIDSATKIKTFTQMMDVIKESVGSGWAAVFQNLFGNFNQASKLWTGVGTKITDVIGNIFKAINTTLIGWKDLGGYTALWKGFGNIFQAIGNILKPFLTALGAISPGTKKAGSGLAAITIGFEKATSWIEQMTRGAAALSPIFEILGTAFGVVLSAVVGVVKYFASLIPLVSGLGGGVASLISDLGEMVVHFLEWADLTGKIQKFFDTLIQGREEAFGPILDTVGAIVAALGTLVKGDISGFKTQFKEALTLLDPLVEKIQYAAAYAEQLFSSLAAKGEGTLNRIAGALANAAAKVQEFTDKVLGAFNSFKEGADSAAESGTTKLVSATDSASNAGSRMIDIFKSIGGWVKSAAVAVGQGISSIWSSITGWAKGLDQYDVIAAFSLILNGYILLMVRRFLKGFSGFLGVFEDVSGAFQQLTGTLKTMQTAVRANIIKTIAISVGILAASLWLLSTIPVEKMKLALGAITILMGQVVGVMTLLGKGKLGDFASKNLLAVGAAMIMISGALVNMAAAVAIFGKMDTATIARGLIAIGATLGLLVAASLGLGAVQKPILSAAASLVIMSVALQLMAATILIYDKINFDTFASGLLKMGAALALLVIAMNKMPTKSIIKNSIALGIMATSLNILAAALMLFASMSVGQIAKSLITLGVAMGILVASMSAMQGMTSGAMALALVASSIIILATALNIMGSMDLASIGKGLLALTGALVVFLAAGLAAQFVAAGLLALGTAIAMVGVGMLAAGVGMAAFAAGLAVLVALGTAAFGVITTAIQVFLALLPSIAVQVAAAMVTWLETMAKAAPRIADAFVTIISTMLDAAKRLLPKLIELIDTFLDEFLGSIQRNAPKFGQALQALINTGLAVLRHSIPNMINTGFAIINAFIGAIERNVPKIAASATNIVVSLINGISKHIGRVVTAGTNLIINFIRGISSNAVRLANAAMQTLTDFLNGLATAIRNNSGQINDAGWNIASAIVDGMVNGLTGMAGRVWDAAVDLADGLPKVVKKALGIESPSKVFDAIGGYVGSGLYNGLLASMGLVKKGASSLASSTIEAAKKTLDSHSPSRVFKSMGLDVGRGFVQGIMLSLKMVRNAGVRMAKYTVDTISKTTSDLQLRANAQAAKADAAQSAADFIRRMAQDKKLSKARKEALEKEAKQLEAQAKKARVASTVAQRGVDAAVARAEAKREFKAADEMGKSDILTARAERAAEAAEKQRRLAIQLAREADLIRDKDAKRAKALEKQSRIAMRNAQRAAASAQSNAQKAQEWAIKAVLNSSSEVKADLNAWLAEEEAEKAFAKMTLEQQAAEMKRRSDESQKKSDSLIQSARDKLKQADILAKTDAEAAQALVESAAADVEKAKALRDQAEQEAETAKSLADQISQNAEQPPGDTTTPSDTVQPPLDLKMPEVNIASSLVYGAQNMFDAYARALAETSDAAAADKAAGITFVQNNTSPVALSPTEIYRQSKNLLSDAERKLASALT